jgi:hypothetical protein
MRSARARPPPERRQECMPIAVTANAAAKQEQPREIAPAQSRLVQIVTAVANRAAHPTPQANFPVPLPPRWDAVSRDIGLFGF